VSIYQNLSYDCCTRTSDVNGLPIVFDGDKDMVVGSIQ
jgi:hypothetical protein